MVDGGGARVLRASDLMRAHSAASSEEVSQGGHGLPRHPSGSGGGGGLMRSASPVSSEDALYKRHMLGPGLPLPGQHHCVLVLHV